MQQPNTESKDQGPLVIEGPESAQAKFLADRFIKSCMHGDPVNDREYADLFLAGINDSKLSVHDWIRLLGGAVTEDGGKQPARELNPARVRYYRSILAHAVNAKESAEARGHVEGAYLMIERINGRIAAIPYIYWEKDKLHVSHKVVGIAAEDCIDYAFALTLAHFSEQLRQCRRCGKFFLYSPDEDQRKYCRPKCREEHTEDDGKYRTYAHRAGVTAGEWRALMQFDPTFTVKRWKEISSKRARRLTVEQWIAEQEQKRSTK